MILVKMKLMKLVFMVGEDFGWIVDFNGNFAMPMVRLPDWFIADVARDSHSIGSLISSFIHQT